MALALERLGVVMAPSEDPQESWGVLNPAGVRAADGSLHLFPRIVAEGNYSRIAHAQVRYRGDVPVGVERLGTALEPQEQYEVTSSGGGVEDPRTCWIAPLGTYVMTYTAFIPFEPRVAVAVSRDLVTWRRLGLRTPAPLLEPSADYERFGTVADVVFPTATDLRADGRLDVYYGAADRVIAVARLTLPDSLPDA